MTKENKCKTYLSQFPHYTDSAYDIVAPYLSTKSIDKGEHILRQDQRCQWVTFIESGLFRVYYLINGKEITTSFCKENRFVASYQSLLTNHPSEHSIQALEDSEIVIILYDDLKKLYDQYPFWQQIGRMVTEQEYIITESYTRLINDNSAKQRYLEILNNEPDLIQRVSLSCLASYIQVTPETISRIRKDLSSRH